MNLALLGATGSLGRECLAQALEAGHDVTVLARTPSKLPGDVRDRIAVVDGGRIVELGSHDELVTRRGRYAAMFETWVRHGGAA